MSNIERYTIISICAAIRQAKNPANSPAVKAWAIQLGKRRLLEWSTLRTI